MTLAELNALPSTERADTLRRCCGAEGWVVGLNAVFPFEDATTLFEAAEKEFQSLTETGWREAFSHHPKIGDVDALKQKFANAATWAAGEQGAVHAASQATLEALAAGNAQYEQKFGYLFIVCANGESADEMLALLRQRLPHTPEEELPVAAAEQKKITRFRLEEILAA